MLRLVAVLMGVFTCRGTSVDVEHATATAALSTAAVVTTATAVAPTPLLAKDSYETDGPLMGSGPRLAAAISQATSTPADMIPVPVCEQQVTAMQAPASNDAVLNSSATQLTATTTADATAHGITAGDAGVEPERVPSLAALTRLQSSTFMAHVPAASVAAEPGPAVILTSAAAAATVATTVVATERVAASGDRAVVTTAGAQSVPEVDFVGTAAAAAGMHAQPSGDSVSVSTFSACTVREVVSCVQLEGESSNAAAVAPASKSGSMLESGTEHSQEPPANVASSGVSSDGGADKASDYKNMLQGEGTQDQPVDGAALTNSGNGVPNVLSLASKLERMHSAMR